MTDRGTKIRWGFQPDVCSSFQREKNIVALRRAPRPASGRPLAGPLSGAGPAATGAEGDFPAGSNCAAILVPRKKPGS